MSTSPLKNKRVQVLIKILISVMIIWFLYQRGDVFEGVLTALKGVQIWPLLVFLAILLFNTGLSSYKWQVLLSADGIQVPLLTLIRSYLVAAFFNLFMPSNIGGDVYRVSDIGRYSSRPANTLAAVFADRLSGFIVLVLYGLAFAYFSYQHVTELWILLLPVAAFVALLFLIWCLFQQKLICWGMKITRLDRIAILTRTRDKCFASFEAYGKRPAILVRIMMISMVFQFNVIIGIYLLSRALQLGIHFKHFCTFVPFISLVEAVPITINGAGLRDMAYELCFMSVGATREASLALAVLYMAVSITYSLIGGCVFLASKRSASEPPAA